MMMKDKLSPTTATTTTTTNGTNRPPRQSPRWKEPLVEEFHPPPPAVPQTPPEERRQQPQWHQQQNGGGYRQNGGTPTTARSKDETTTNGIGTTRTTTKTFRTPDADNGNRNADWDEEVERHWRRERRHFVDEQREEKQFLNGGGGKTNNNGWKVGSSRELHDEEQLFFSEEFYRAFPHLRPTSSNGQKTFNGIGIKPAEEQPFVQSSSSSMPSTRSPFPRTTTSMPTSSNRWAEEPEFSSYLDRFDRNWRNDPFWRELYPRWAEPIFKDGIDVKTTITNDSQRFAVEIDSYQFRPEELQVKTLDDTLLIEGRHEDVRDRDNYTKMYFVRKYQLPTDVDPQSISSQVDSRGRLTVEAHKRWNAIEGRERSIPIESPSGRRYGSRSSSSYSPRDRYYYDSGRGSANDYYRAGSRQDGGGGGGTYLSPTQPERKSNGYHTEFEKRETDANGMRHETRREEFREEVRRTGSAANVLPPPTPIYRTGSRLSATTDAAAGGATESRSESHFRRASSSNEYRQYSNGAAGSENLLRPAEELGGRISVFGRSVPIQRA